MKLPTEAISELQWWAKKVWHSFSPIIVIYPTLVTQTDSSAQGWGVTNAISSTGGRWTNPESSLLLTLGINYLEMLGAFYGLKAYASNMHHLHVRLQIDNTTVVAYINHMGGIKSLSCDMLVNTIWQWCVERHIWLSATYLPGKLNTVADTRSRKFNDNIEWMLNPKIFAKIVKQYGTPDIDLFASRLNHQVPMYVAWEPDPEAAAVDAFALDWGNFFFYAFPPFCLISRVLRKIQMDSASGILIVPDSPTQPWLAILHDMIVETPMIFPSGPELLKHPVSGISHPCHEKNQTPGLQILIRPFLGLALSEQTVDTMSASLRTSTKKQYLTSIKKWEKYCLDTGTTYTTATVTNVLEFLAKLHYEEGLSYSAINTARNALSAYLTLAPGQQAMGSHPLVVKLMKGIYNTNPPRPRYTHIWDVSVVLTYLRGWPPARSLSLEQSTLKTLMLMALVSAQRVQSLHRIRLDNMITAPDQISFVIQGLIKQSRPGTPSPVVIFRAYPPEPRLCVMTHLMSYIDTTNNIRGSENNLWVSHKKPHGRVMSQTILRWLKQVLKAAGIDTNV
ncbi:uncharacterized protein LOC129695449 [Leucoraja erinacea]|uniref:uncharacterized protein LOC129695449 n=1 Tax=Leucoraja erinaceus TaxID=7782 RepID=UPI00245413B4|nr:uncharacterized protein LOC129695449 [Leucoraja erinacea]